MSERSFINNQNLFSNNYLEKRLPATSLWSEQQGAALSAYEKIKASYAELKALNPGPGKEAELEDKFISPVLKTLGFQYSVQPVTKRGFKKKRPDYALFKDIESQKAAGADKDDSKMFFSHASTILEAKSWGRRLNDTDGNDILDSRDPTAQTVKYLEDVHYHSDGKINWAILTNGRAWRLFYYRAASRSGHFYEVDIQEIIDGGDAEGFLYFYLFFSKDAFIPDAVTGKTWLDHHIEGSEAYATEISEKLKALIFDKIFQGLAEGFLYFRKTELSIFEETEKGKADIFKGCMTLLYRLLFLLYAESRNLLPVTGAGYGKVSFKRLKEDIFKDLSTGIGGISGRSYVYWARLESLSRIISEGDPSLNVPVYNGGLFETPRGGFLSENKISDTFLAEAVKLLTVESQGDNIPGAPSFIDYSSLSVRHLGDIYEGLLEFHIEIADAGVYIENSKHERKATGSYYTPHYIVEYIVKNTVGEALKERLERASNLFDALQSLYEKQRGELKMGREWKHWEHRGEPQSKYITDIDKKEKEIFDTLFDLKILDPSMGSGHFLVHAVDFVSDKIIAFLANHPDSHVIGKIRDMKREILDEIKRQGVSIDEERLTEVNLIKRMVMKRCIYGVDINDMAVELSKLSLWLDSFTLGAPLSFLDHHLKCGNSLIGVMDISKVIAPGSETYNKVQRSLSCMLLVSELTDSTISEAKKSFQLFRQAQNEIEPIRRRFNVATARHFMHLNNNIARMEALAYTLEYDKEPYSEIVTACKQALDLAEEKRFFHWMIEFPEAFYTERGFRENPGFDCVIGNPPYGMLSRENFFKITYLLINPNWNIYIAFMEKGISLVNQNGYHSYIVPTSWETGIMFELLRKSLLNQTSIRYLINLPFDVFKDAYVDTGIFVARKISDASNRALVYEYPKKIKIDTISIDNYEIIEQRLWMGAENQILLNPRMILMIPKLLCNSIKLEEITTSARGVLALPEDIIPSIKEDCHPFFDGELYRYEISRPDKHIKYSDDLPEKPSDIEFFKGCRVLIRRLISRQDCLMASCVKDFFVSKKDIYIFKLIKDISYSSYYILALINSKLLSFVYLNQDILSQKDDFRQATLEGIRKLPIPIIAFTTPAPRRTEILAKAIALYNSSPSTTESVLKWAETELSGDRTDTVHDLLAWLAGQMIETNKSKNKEVRGFLEWLEREIGAKIETLTNKTAVKSYHDHDFNHLGEVLKKNKKKISVNPSRREFQALLEDEFVNSMAVLNPLKEKIRTTDALIDEIVYKLYRLTQEEITVVKAGVA